MNLKRKTVPVATPVVLLLLLGGGLDAQQRQIPDMLPAAAQPPAEVREMEELERRAGRDPVRQVTREHVLRALEQLEPGSTRPENLRRREGTPLPAAAGPPEEIREAEQRERAARGARQPPAPTRERLLEVIRAEPGGREMLEEARRRGAPISASARTSRLSRLLAWIHPLRIREARAQSSFSVTLTPSNPHSSDPLASLYFHGARIFFCCANHRVTLMPGGWDSAGLTHSVQAPSAQLGFRVPAAGWYLINVRALQERTYAQLSHYNSSVRTWDYGAKGLSWQDYPALVQLSAGWHTFYFMNTRNRLEVSQVSMFAL